MGQIFQKVEILNEQDADLKNLNYDIKATEIRVDLKNDRIRIIAEKIYKDINDNIVFIKDASYYEQDPERIEYWNNQLGNIIAPAIINKLKINAGISV